MTALKELTLEEITLESSISEAEKLLSAYWAYRNSLLEEYGREHFFDLDRVIPRSARKKLNALMDRYIREVQKEKHGVA